jgi:hypothetical protein
VPVEKYSMRSKVEKLLLLIFLLATALITGERMGCSQMETMNVFVKALPRSMKGYELYSWQVEGRWNFALMTGTNAFKPVERITNGADKVEDGWVELRAGSVDELKLILGGLPKDESIVWIGRASLADPGPLQIPPQAIVDSVSSYCKELGLSLEVSP